MLTEREQEVLELVARGLKDEFVAEKLDISVRHLRSIFLKTGAENRTAAASWYYTEGRECREK